LRLVIIFATVSICLLPTSGRGQSNPASNATSRPEPAANQQDSGGSSLSETTSWLSERIGEARISGSSSDANYTSTSSMGSFRAEWDGCKLVLHYIHQVAFRSNDPTSHPNLPPNTCSTAATVNLSFLSETVGTSEAKDLMGMPLTTPAWNVTLTARGNDRPFVWHGVCSSGGTEQTHDYSSPFLPIPFESEEIAGRVAKAFSHAIHLCSQKKEPF